MRSLMSVAPGGPDTLQLLEVPVPEPGTGEVRLAVRACAINYPDTLVIEDKYQMRPPRPFAPGHEVAGVVEALGAGVTAPAVGTPVIASAGYGGLAEKIVVRAAHCTPLPEGISVTEGLRQPAGRWEMARFGCGAAAGIGLLMAMFPKGR